MAAPSIEPIAYLGKGLATGHTSHAHLLLLGLGFHSGHVVDQVHTPVRVPDLVVVPADQLDELLRELQAGGGVDYGGVRVPQKVTGHHRIGCEPAHDVHFKITHEALPQRAATKTINPHRLGLQVFAPSLDEMHLLPLLVLQVPLCRKEAVPMRIAGLWKRASAGSF